MSAKVLHKAWSALNGSKGLGITGVYIKYRYIGYGTLRQSEQYTFKYRPNAKANLMCVTPQPSHNSRKPPPAPRLGDEAACRQRHKDRPPQCNGQGVWWCSPHAIWNHQSQTGERTERLDTAAIKQRVRRGQTACKHKDSPISPEERQQTTL